MTDIVNYGPMTAQLLSTRGVPKGVTPKDVDVCVGEEEIEAIYHARPLGGDPEESHATAVLEGRAAPLTHRR